MSKAKKNILFAALAALALTVCLVGVTGAYFIAQASRTNTLTVGEVTFDPKEDIQNPDVPVQPGNSFMKRPYVVNTGNLPLRLRARVIFSDSAAQDACTLNYNTENWRYDETEDFWYYAKTLQPGEDCRNDALFDCFACAVAALGGVDRRLGRHIVLHVCVSLSASTHRRLPRQNAARLSARFRLLPVRDAVFIGTYARPGCFRVYRGIFLPVNRTVRPCQSPGTAPERERTESTSAAHLHSAADCGRPYGSSFIFPPRLGCLYSVRCFCGCVITCNLVARLWCTIALYYQTLGEKT